MISPHSFDSNEKFRLDAGIGELLTVKQLTHDTNHVKHTGSCICHAHRNLHKMQAVHPFHNCALCSALYRFICLPFSFRRALLHRAVLQKLLVTEAALQVVIDDAACL